MTAPGRSAAAALPSLLNEAAVGALLRMEDLIDLMERTLADFSSGRTVQPGRTVVPIQEHDALMAVMPGYLPGAGAAAVQAVTVAPRNAARGLPSHLATVRLPAPG